MIWYESSPYDDFVAALEHAMTTEQALQIKGWRKTQTWRYIAEECHEAYMAEWQVCWTMPGHQMVGAAITEAAAARLGEDAEAPDWNGYSGGNT